jgi:hypothetical protein
MLTNKLSGTSMTKNSLERRCCYISWQDLDFLNYLIYWLFCQIVLGSNVSSVSFSLSNLSVLINKIRTIIISLLTCED